MPPLLARVGAWSLSGSAICDKRPVSGIDAGCWRWSAPGTWPSSSAGTLSRSYALVMRDVPWPPAAAERAAALAGPGAAVREMRALAGGTHASTWLIRTVNPECEFVLREFPPGDDAAA